MNLRYASGTLFVCVPLNQLAVPPASGDFVLVHRRDGLLWQVTLREYRRDDDGRWWVWPRSHDPRFQAPERIVVRPTTDLGDPVIAAKAIAAYSIQ